MGKFNVSISIRRWKLSDSKTNLRWRDLKVMFA